MNICYIVGAGEFYGEIHRDDSDLVIAADGGYDALISHGVGCDLLIGDLDSIKEVPKKTEILRFPVEKDDTNTFLAFKEGYERGYRIFRIYGGTGGRPDHTYANYQLLLYAKRRGADAYLYGEGTVTLVLKNESRTLTGVRGGTFPFSHSVARRAVLQSRVESTRPRMLYSPPTSPSVYRIAFLTLPSPSLSRTES